MSDIVERLREKIITDAFTQGEITSGALAERLIRERLDAADEIQRLRAENERLRAENGLMRKYIMIDLDESSRAAKAALEGK